MFWTIIMALILLPIAITIFVVALPYVMYIIVWIIILLYGLVTYPLFYLLDKFKK